MAFAAKWADLVFVIYHGLEDGIGEYAAFKALVNGTRTAERRMFATISFTNTGSLSWKRSPSRRGSSRVSPSSSSSSPSTILGLRLPARIEAVQ